MISSAVCESAQDDTQGMALTGNKNHEDGKYAWYLYGITERSESGKSELAACTGLDRGKVRSMTCGELAAVVSRVPFVEFCAEGIRARVKNVSWLEAMVRGHERVVEAVHRQRTILPAKFGCVYSAAEDLMVALGSAHDALLAQIRRLEGCDEWGVRLYAHLPTIRQRVEADNVRVRQLRENLSGAQPGHAYFLQKTLVEALDSATEQVLSSMSERAYDHLSHHAIAAKINEPTGTCGGSEEEDQLLQAAFLLARPSATGFVAALHRFAEGVEGLRCTYSGPWPPYSFLEHVEGALPCGDLHSDINGVEMH